ncbi:hypothetical protein Vadar_034729 [Vaccinium darrowii]|uniref:Uncharacterized protein n=1 Tax=Vaccinium darrowii TaxID=229202 RepID=A0ACB7X6G1_9ERIC|nr:hypothetical protein Vadar_034729 [Vaccinium darrowii]
MEQPNDHAMEVIDKLKKQIETLEQEKKKLEIENTEIRQKNEEALQSHKDEIEMLKSKLEETQGTKQGQIVAGNKKDVYIDTLRKKMQILEELNREFEAKNEDYEVHQITQNYSIETEREVHQVTQQATTDKINRLQKENEESENELLSIIVHQVTQDFAPTPNANSLIVNAMEEQGQSQPQQGRLRPVWRPNRRNS